MDKKDYLSQATKKIYNSSARMAVAEELSEHIDEKQEFFESIDYEQDAASSKAVEAMGEAELVSDYFGELHNETYNPLFDIALFAIWMGILFGIYYLLQKFIFSDGGSISLMYGSVFIAASMLFAHISLSLKRKRLVPALFSFIGLGATSVYNYFIFAEIGKTVDSSFKNVIKSAFSSFIPIWSNYYNKTRVTYALAVFAAISLVGILILLVYLLKKTLRISKQYDNSIRRTAVKLYRYFAVLFLALTLFFAAKFFIDIDSYKNEYCNVYKELISICESCSNADDVKDYIKHSKITFSEDVDKDGTLKGYIYDNNYTYAYINVIPVETDESEKYDLIYNNTVASLIHEVLPAKNSVDLVSAKLYANQRKTVKNGFSTISLSAIKCDEIDEESLSEFVEYKVKSDEALKKYTEYIPTRFSFGISDSKIHDKHYSFTYLIQSGDFSYEENRYVSSKTKLYYKIDKEKDKLLKIINKNSELKPEELAIKTKATLKEIDLTDNYRKLINEIGYGGVSDNVKLKLDTYLLKNGIYYILGNRKPPYYYVFIADKKSGYVTAEFLGEQSAYSNRTTEDFKSVSVNGWYFDKMGRCYSEPERIAFYTKDGRKYYFKSVIEHTGDTSIGDIKHKYLTDRKTSYHEVSSCYIDEDGYLYFDTSNSLKYDSSRYYKSPSGKKYTKALETAFDENGEIIFQKDK